MIVRRRCSACCRGRHGIALLTVLATGAMGASAVHRAPQLPPVAVANDNRQPAGRATAGEVELVLTARLARWHPDGDRRPAPLLVPAFAEGDGPPLIPGPLIRVPAGTRVRVTVRNALDGPLAGTPLVVHGLHARTAGRSADSTRKAPVRVPAGERHEVVFEAGAPGTYYYWGALSDTTAVERRAGIDAALSGAIVVDPHGGRVVPDRVFVMHRMALAPEGDGATRQPERFVVTINGLSWPHTERLDAAVGDTVRWRWVNPTNEHHPMHLHGFFFHVDALGDQHADTAYSAADRKYVVTERMREGGTMAMTWVPARAGNWLVHCHLHKHSAPDSTWGFPDVPGTGAFGDAVVGGRSATAAARAAPAVAPAAAPSHATHDMDRDMAGLVLGIRVRPGSAETVAAHGAHARHDVRLTVLPPSSGTGAPTPLRLRVDDPLALGGRATAQSAGIGPPIVLQRDAPARVTVVNRTGEATALHWHGMELESYFDGVPGWTGGQGGGGPRGRLSPAIEPGDEFAALMTPPRAGTFIYHSHALTTTQLGDGLYGPLIVLEAGERYDPAREVTWIIAGHERGDGDRAFLLLNGTRTPPPLTLVAGRRYRVRLINITETNTADVALLDGEAADAAPVVWRPLAKDAVALAGTHAAVRPARLRTSVGETFDFELVAPRAGVLRLEVRNGGDLMVQQRVLVR